MKRFLVFSTVLAIALLASTLAIMAQPLAPSVPNLINFQGKLTTAGGPPVVDGPHSFIFRIFDASAGGTLLWSDGPVIIGTTGGLFTYVLGSGLALPENLFIDDNPHYLEVEADGAIISPRTQLVSTPFTRVANGLESMNPFTGVTQVRTEDALHGLSTYGVDGLEQTRLWGGGFGEILLFDVDPTNEMTARLSANGSFGGYLELNRNDGSLGTQMWGGDNATFGSFLRMTNVPGAVTIQLDGDTPGDPSTLLPANAINAGEMLNEPGIASSFAFGTTVLTTSADSTLDSVSVTVPTSGFVVVTMHCFITLDHVTGTRTIARLSISETYSTHDFDNMTLEDIHAPVPSTVFDDGYRSISLTKVEAVPVGTHKYYFIADHAVGGVGSSTLVARRHMTAMFFPTAYGTVVSSVASRPGALPSMTDGSDLPPSELKVITAEEHQASVATEQARQMAELEARIKKLEQVANQVKQQRVDE